LADRNGGSNSYAEIRINGEDVVSKQNSKRGINLVVLNGPDHKILLNESYNTFSGKKDESARLVADFKKIPSGSVIIAAVKDDASKNLKRGARKIFMDMGSQAIKKLGFKSAWGFIGIKGMKKSGENVGTTVEFGTALSYTKTVTKRKEVQKVEGGSKIQAMSAGFKHGNTARIVVNDEDVLGKAGRGLNIVVLAGQNHEVMFKQTYDTYANGKASSQIVEDEAAVPPGSVIIIACMDECSAKLSQGVKDILVAMGAKEINGLGFREGYLFMGIKGTKSHLEKKGPSVNAGMILGYSRVKKTIKTKVTKTMTQTKSYKRTITRVVKKKVVTVKNGVRTTRVITRVQKRTVTCKRSRKVTKTRTTSQVTHR